MDSTTIYWRLTAEPCGSRRTPSARRKTRLLRRCDLTWQWCLTWLDGFHNDWLVVLTILKHMSQWEGLSHILWKIFKMFETTKQVIMIV